jgi:hypothetical protein
MFSKTPAAPCIELIQNNCGKLKLYGKAKFDKEWL